MYFLVMSKHTIHYDMNINELRQCCFDSGDSLNIGYTTPTRWFSGYTVHVHSTSSVYTKPLSGCSVTGLYHSSGGEIQMYARTRHANCQVRNKAKLRGVGQLSAHARTCIVVVRLETHRVHATHILSS